MNKTLLTFVISLFFVTGLLAQKYAYVDTEYILENIPEYKDAQNQLDELSADFQAELEDKYVEIDKMYKDFQAEAVLMPDDVKQKKEQELNDKKTEVRELQKQRFGKDGDLFMKREELIKPIQEKIYNAIEEIATDKNYAFVFDKAGSLTILYVNAKYDISDDVLDAVGAELGTVNRSERKKNNYTPPPKSNNNKTNKSNTNRPPSGPGGGPGPVRKK
jgi:outer membrane protein